MQITLLTLTFLLTVVGLGVMYGRIRKIEDEIYEIRRAIRILRGLDPEPKGEK